MLIIGVDNLFYQWHQNQARPIINILNHGESDLLGFSHHKTNIVDVHDINFHYQVPMILYYIWWHSDIIRHHCHQLYPHCFTFEILEVGTVYFINHGEIIRSYGSVQN